MDMQDLSDRLQYIIELLEERERKFNHMMELLFEEAEGSLLDPPLPHSTVRPDKAHLEGADCWCEPHIMEENGYVVVYHRDVN